MQQKTPILLRKYPLASSYVLGVYNGSMELLDFVYHLEDSENLFGLLDREIQRHHSDWSRDEIYWRGVDVAEKILDEIHSKGIKSPKKIHLALKRIVRDIGHHPKLIIITHTIGKRYIKQQIS